MNEASGTCCSRVIKAADAELGAVEAVHQCKADHDLAELDDEAAGFKAVAIYSKEHLAQILRTMELPEPDLSADGQVEAQECGASHFVGIEIDAGCFEIGRERLRVCGGQLAAKTIKD